MFTPQVIFLTVLVFFVLVGIHEWGHFIFARRAGILVRDFSIGFGPKLFSFKKGETRFTFGIIPAGGYIRMAGEEPEVIRISEGQTIAVRTTDGQVSHLFLDHLDQRTNVVQGVVEQIDLDKNLQLRLNMGGETEAFPIHPKAMMIARGKETQIAPFNRQFGGKTTGQRAMTIFAGPLMNFVLAFVLFLSYAWVSGVPEHVKLFKVMPGSAAEAAQLQADDIVISVNGKEIGTDRELFVQMIESSAGQEMKWVVQRGEQLKVIAITPQQEAGKGIAGINTIFQTRSATVGEVFSNAGTTMVEFTKQIFIGLKQLVTLQFKLDDLGGPVRIVEVTGQAASMGMATLLLWAAILSLYLGIFNLIPFPALDGSRLLFIGIEAVRGKPIDPNREGMVHFIGFAMIMMLMLAVTYNDILRLFKG